jgi:hypothetical protein
MKNISILVISVDVLVSVTRVEQNKWRSSDHDFAS